MRKILYLLMVGIIIVSCNSENHYHDGKYQTQIMFAEVILQISGNEVIVENSLSGTSQFNCTQYSDRIEYEEDNGITRILMALENGDLKFNDQIVFNKKDDKK